MTCIAPNKTYSLSRRRGCVDKHIVDDNLNGEMVLVSFPVPSGGGELKGHLRFPFLCRRTIPKPLCSCRREVHVRESKIATEVARYIAAHIDGSYVAIRLFQ